MKSETIPVNITILDREYQIACSEEEYAPLLESARYLDEKMREVKAGGRIIELDRIAVITALNITHELVQARRGGLADEEVEVSARLVEMQHKIDQALADDEK